MNQPITNTTQQDMGLFPKFNVSRKDGKGEPGGTHEHDEYFVLELTQDKHSIPAIAAYANSCTEEYPALARDLRGIVNKHYDAQNEFIIVPETAFPDSVIPGGYTEPSFKIAKYPCSKSSIGTAVVNVDGKPWTNISYFESMEALALAGMNPVTETQWLAISWQIYHQDANWTGGKVGEGQLFRGLHKGNVSGPQNGHYDSTDLEERTWHVLANGEHIYHIAGNVYEWVFDNIQGDENGVINRPFAADSLTKLVPPCPSGTNGIGSSWVGENWSGNALLRGGYWGSGSHAGVFSVRSVDPSYRGGDVGFRGTKSL